MKKKEITFIINPKSGTNDKYDICSKIETMINSDIYNVGIIYTEYAGHASDIASMCVKSGCDVCVAVGGDGTVNEVARGLVDSNTALGIIPCGSGNGLARHLMLPLDVEGALDIINKNVVHELDYGMINVHPFFCTCGMGFDAFISKKFAEAGKRGPLTYIENVLKEGLKYEPETYELTIDGNDQVVYKAFLISIANASQYGNDAYIAPQASMRDGFLDVVIMEPFDLLEAPQVGIDLMNKTINHSSKIKSFKAKEIIVKRSHGGVIHYDGDPIEEGDILNISLKHKGIKVVVNGDADKTRRKPNTLQSAFSQIFNELNVVRNEVVDGVTHPVKQVKSINNFIQNKLNKK